MTFEFKELCVGPSWRRILGPFERLSQAEAHAIDWLRERGYEIVDRDTDGDAIDLMTARGNAVHQFAIEKVR